MHVCLRLAVRHDDVSNFGVVPRTIKTLVVPALWVIQRVRINVGQPKIVLCAFELFEDSDGSKLGPCAPRSIMRKPSTCLLHRAGLKQPLWAFFLASAREEERCIVTFVHTAVVGTIPLSRCCCAQHAFGACTLADITTTWCADAAGMRIRGWRWVKGGKR